MTDNPSIRRAVKYSIAVSGDPDQLVAVAGEVEAEFLKFVTMTEAEFVKKSFAILSVPLFSPEGITFPLAANYVPNFIAWLREASLRHSRLRFQTTMALSYGAPDEVLHVEAGRAWEARNLCGSSKRFVDWTMEGTRLIPIPRPEPRMTRG
jgi:hypothetical protein